MQLRFWSYLVVSQFRPQAAPDLGFGSAPVTKQHLYPAKRWSRCHTRLTPHPHKPTSIATALNRADTAALTWLLVGAEGGAAEPSQCYKEWHRGAVAPQGRDHAGGILLPSHASGAG